MKIVSRIFIVLLSLAAAAFLGIAVFAPEKGLELQEKLENAVMQRSEAVEISPVRTLEVAYDFNVQEILDQGCDTGYQDVVYTWFRDLNRDLWVPFEMNGRFAYTPGGAAICNQEGVVKRLEAGACMGGGDFGECGIPAEALADLPEGDYWLALQVVPDEIIENVSGPWYVLRYVSVHDRCDFHTEDYRVANQFDVLFDRSSGEGFTYHLANLGDNVVQDVWKLEYSLSLSEDMTFTQKRLKEGKDYIISPDGASVTITAEYLASLQDLYGYNFEFGLADHSSLNTALSAGEGAVLYLTDGPVVNAPYIDGPMAHSLSSGQDYAFTLHMGRAQQVWKSELFFYDEEGQPAMNPDGTQKNWLPDYSAGLREGETCVVPASVIQEAAAAGYSQHFWLGFSFQVTDFGYSGYYPYSGYSVNLEP